MKISKPFGQALTISLFVFISTNLKAQELYISWKRIADLAGYVYEDGNKLERARFAVFNFCIEKPLKSSNYSLGLDLAYANYHPRLNYKYNYLGDRKQFHDRSFSVGVLGRAYTRPRVFRLFGEVAVYGNYLHIKQPVVIEHSYGTYERIIDNEKVLISGSIAVGFSLGNKRFRWEPYVQWGVMPSVSDKRAGLLAISSIGMVRSNHSYIIAPAVLKIMLY